MIFAVQLYADDKKEDYNSYTIQVDAFWFDAHPTGSLEAARHNGSFDFQRDLALGSYATFAGKLDWKFTRKNHLFFSASPFERSRKIILNRSVMFQGQTFDAGLSAVGNLRVLALAAGYQYDFIRRKRGHLGVVLQFDLFNISGTLSTAAQVSNGVFHAATTSKGSLRAPIPIAGPDLRLYLLPHSSRLFVTANVLGMYLFGYGNFVSTFDTLGVSLAKHLSVRGGYALASRLNVNTENNRVGLNLTQKGAIAGLEVSF
ncbi:MAG TPA: hypothetical protein VGK36_21865 [Candidatus Angelobacter sp.]